MANRHREQILREIEATIAELRTYSGHLIDKRIERLELERDWICSHPGVGARRGTSSKRSGRFPG